MDRVPRIHGKDPLASHKGGTYFTGNEATNHDSCSWIKSEPADEFDSGHDTWSPAYYCNDIKEEPTDMLSVIKKEPDEEDEAFCIGDFFHVGDAPKVKTELSPGSSAGCSELAFNRSRPTGSFVADNPYLSGRFPNLTLYFPPRKRAKELNDPVMTLFESCCRSHVRLKIDSVREENTEYGVRGQWASHIYIENEHITVRRRPDLYRSKTVAAEASLRILSKRNSYRCNTLEESFLLADEIVPGLTLFLEDRSPVAWKDHSFRVLTDSCKRCNLSVSWWHDKDSQVFGPSYQNTTVLLINSKPICWGFGYNLVYAKDKTTLVALNMLTESHPIVCKDNAVGSGASQTSKKLTMAIPGLTLQIPYPGGEYVEHPCSTLQRSALHSKMQVGLKNMLNKRNRVYATKLLIGDTVVAWGYGKTLKMARNNVWTEALEALLKIQPIVYELEMAPTAGSVYQPSTKKRRVDEEELSGCELIWLDY